METGSICMALLGLDAIYDLHYEATLSEKAGLSRRADVAVRVPQAPALSYLRSLSPFRCFPIAESIVYNFNTSPGERCCDILARRTINIHLMPPLPFSFNKTIALDVQQPIRASIH